MFKFDDINDYNSLKLIERKNYIFGAEATTIEDIEEIAKKVTIKEEPKDIPSPQADTFARLYNFMEFIWNTEEQKIGLEDIALNNNFTLRQAGYYSNAARFLELVVKNDDSTYSLSEVGENFIKATRKERNLTIARQMLQYERYNIVFKEALKRHGKMTRGIAYEALVEADYYERYNDKYGDSTRERRAGTTSSWVKHLFELIDDH